MSGPRGGRQDPHGRGRVAAELDCEIRDRLRRFRATAGLWAKLVTRGDGYERDADRIVPPGCYARLFVLVELLRQVHERALDPNARHRVRPPVPLRGGAKVLGHLVDEPELTVLDCARLMLLFEDAIAFDVVQKALATGARHDAWEPGQAPPLRADRRPPDARPTTVREIGATLEQAVRGTLINEAASSTLLEILRETGSADPSLVPGFLPAGATLGRLRAEAPGTLADASVTFLDGETLVASVYLVQNPAEGSKGQLVDQLTSLLVEWARVAR